MFWRHNIVASHYTYIYCQIYIFSEDKIEKNVKEPVLNNRYFT